MNVALVTTEWPPFPGGIGTYTATLARALAKAGHVPIVLYANAGPPPPASEPGVRLVHFDRPHQPSGGGGADRFPGLATHVHESIGFALAIRDWLERHAREERIDVIEVPDHHGMGAVLQDLDLPPCVVVGHSTAAEFAWHDGLDRTSSDRLLDAFEFIGLATADAVACYSPSYREELEAWLGREVLFAAAPLRPLERSSRESYEGSADGLVRMIVLARLQMAKGAEVVCQALDALGPGAGIEVGWFGKATIVGEKRIDIRDHLAAKYPRVWGKTLCWHGPIPPAEAWDRVHRADGVLVPTVWETYSYAATEAASLGSPLVISDGAGASFLFEDGVSARIVPAGDAGAMAAAMLSLKDPAVRARLGRGAREAVVSRLEDGRVIAERLAVYERAIDQRRLRRRQPIFRQGMSAVTEYLFRWAAEAADRRVVNYKASELLAILGDRASARVRRGLGLEPRHD